MTSALVDFQYYLATELYILQLLAPVLDTVQPEGPDLLTRRMLGGYTDNIRRAIDVRVKPVSMRGPARSRGRFKLALTLRCYACGPVNVEDIVDSMLSACLAILAENSLPWFITTETDASWQYETRVDEGQPKAILIWRNTADFDATWTLSTGLEPRLVQKLSRKLNEFTASISTREVSKVWPSSLYASKGMALAYYWFAPLDSFLAVRSLSDGDVLMGVTVTGTGTLTFSGLEPGQYDFVLFDNAVVETATILSTSPQWTMHEVVSDGPNN